MSTPLVERSGDAMRPPWRYWWKWRRWYWEAADGRAGHRRMRFFAERASQR
jgi:hypothetical protein